MPDDTSQQIVMVNPRKPFLQSLWDTLCIPHHSHLVAQDAITLVVDKNPPCKPQDRWIEVGILTVNDLEE